MKYFYVLCTLLIAGSAYSMDNDLEIISVDSMQTHLKTALAQNDVQNVSHWYNCFKLLIGADWKYFDINQIEKYGELSSALSDMVDPILSKQTKHLDLFERLDKDMKETKNAASWLIHKLEQDQCNVEWAGLLGQGTKTFPSPEALKMYRIQQLKEAGTIKPMD